MKTIKLLLFGCVLLFIFKHRTDIRLPTVFVSRTPEHLQERIQDLEQEIAFKKRIVADIQSQAAKAPAAGTVIATKACGAKLTVSQSAKPQFEAEISKIQREVNALEGELAKARQSSAY